MGLNQNPVEARVYEYDFAIDGGAVGSVADLRGASGQLQAGKSGGAIPAGAVVIGAIVDILTDFTGGASATFDLTIPGLSNATALTGVDPATLDANECFFIGLGSDASGVAVTPLAAAAKPQWDVDTDTVTAGKLRVTVLYINQA
jgi:hypothetical protein